MNNSVLFRNWWVILLQGLLLIVLSIIIFNNADKVLAAIAFWIGLVVSFTGLIGVIAYFVNVHGKRDVFSLFGSGAIFILGILMASDLFITVKAITLVFGMLVAIIGMVLITGGWNSRTRWTLWWVVSLMGIATLILGLKSIFDVYSGIQNISMLIGIAVLVSGIGLVFLAFLKRRIVQSARNQ